MEEAEKDQAKPEAPPVEQAKAVEPKPESRLNRFLVRLLRWLLGILIVAGLGALLAIFTVYMPVRQKLDQSQGEVEQGAGRIAELESEVDRLSAMEAKNDALQAELDKSELHVAILSARADVAAAQLALEQDDPAKARLALSKTGETIKALGSLLKPGEKKLATDLQSRLELALKGIGENAFAAASDLNVLATGLTELENAYFAKP